MMTNTCKTMRTTVLLMVGMLFFSSTGLLAQTRGVIAQGRLEIDNAMDGDDAPGQEHTDFENGAVEEISVRSITVAGKQFLLSSNVRYYDWEGEDIELNRFAVGNLVVVVFKPSTMEAVEVRMDEEYPGTEEGRHDDAQPQRNHSSGEDTIRLENGVYVN